MKNDNFDYGNYYYDNNDLDNYAKLLIMITVIMMNITTMITLMMIINEVMIMNK